MRQAQDKTWGEGRVKVMSLWTQITDELSLGKSLKSVYRSLQVDNLSYSQFHRLVTKYQKKSVHPSAKTTTLPRKNDPPPPPSRHSQQRFAETLSSKPQTFQHDPRPLKDYFAKGAGS